MIIYRVLDTYRGKIKWFGDKGRANFHAGVLASELEMENEHLDPETWIEVNEIIGKNNLIDVLNGMR